MYNGYEYVPVLGAVIYFITNNNNNFYNHFNLKRTPLPLYVYMRRRNNGDNEDKKIDYSSFAYFTKHVHHIKQQLIIF